MAIPNSWGPKTYSERQDDERERQRMDPRDYVDLTADADAGRYQWAGWHRATGHGRTMTKKEYDTVIALIVLEQDPETLRKIAAVTRWQRDAVA